MNHIRQMASSAGFPGGSRASIVFEQGGGEQEHGHHRIDAALVDNKQVDGLASHRTVHADDDDDEQVGQEANDADRKLDDLHRKDRVDDVGGR